MKRATFAETVDILVKAYLNDTLEHRNCYACAVGNIVAARNGYAYTKCRDRALKKLALVENKGSYCGGLGGGWYDIVVSIEYYTEIIPSYKEELKNNLGMKEINSTGYSLEEVIEIETAFESANRGSNEDEYMFNGLMAVIEVLADIHGIDLKSKEEAKLLFVKETSGD